MSTDRLGTLPYMAPEQARNPARAVIESDVYSLGATLYEAITGRPPFQAETLVGALELLEKQEPDPPRRINPRVDRDLETICLKCLEKEPPRRYSSALKLAEDLQRYRRQRADRGPAGRPDRAGSGSGRGGTRPPPRSSTVTALLLVALFAIVQSVPIAGGCRRRCESSDHGLSEGARHGGRDRPVRRAPARRPSRGPEGAARDRLETEYGDYLARRGNDPRFARDSATVLTRVARILNLFGDAGRRPRDPRAGAGDPPIAGPGRPRGPALRAELAETWHDIGILRAPWGRAPRRSTPTARRCRSARTSSTLAPANRSFLSDLARSHGYIGDWERESGHLDEASRVVRQGAADPRGAVPGRSLRPVHQVPARAELQQQRPSRARAGRPGQDAHAAVPPDEGGGVAWQGARVQQELVALDPATAQAQLEKDTKTLISFTDFQADLAGTHTALGILWSELGQKDGKRKTSTAGPGDPRPAGRIPGRDPVPG